ncbi:MAG TPA: hypothetical protein VGF95_01485 [Solirubrobacteraceae bacterium]|jgi:uncharacterized repeat protein (TIGR01451 family)
MRQAFGNWQRRAALLAILACATMAALAGAAQAAESARWAVTAVPSPTNLRPESPRSDTERLTVDATGGTFTIAVFRGNQEAQTTPLPYNATAAQVETALNEAEVVPEVAGATMAVTGGPGGSAPYMLTWEGGLTDTSLAREEVRLKVLSSELTGGSHTASLETINTGVSAAELTVRVVNVGDAASGGPVTVTDILPTGLTATAVRAEDAYKDYEGFFGGMECQTSPVLECTYNGTVDPGDSFIMTITLQVDGGLPASVENEVQVTGGGLPQANAVTPLPVSETPAPFGVAPHSVVAALSSAQAGAHANVTTSFEFATKETNVMSESPKDVHFDLPPGIVGNTVGMPRCTMTAVLKETQNAAACPADTMVGMATIVVGLGGAAGQFVVPVYNIAPAPGEPAAFGIDAVVVPVRLDTTVLGNGNDAVQVNVPDIDEGAHVYGSSITMWGVPADHSGPGPDTSIYNLFTGGSFGGSSGTTRVPLLTNGQQCTEPLSAGLEADSWTRPGSFVASEAVSLGELTGCDLLRLTSSFSMLPDTLEAGVPAGFDFDLSVPQNNAVNGLATPNVKAVSLKLPEGVVVNPSAAWGLKACSNAQFYGPRHPAQEPASPAECPREAQVGTVWIKTPALEEALEGKVYLAEPACDGPCTPEDAEDGKMIRLFVQAVSEGEGGIVIKLEGRGHIDQKTGQITTDFEENPQLPFSEFKLKLAGGPRAVLANPRSCGPVTSSMDLTPWSTPSTPDSTSSSTFEINEKCFGPQFAPSFKAGMPNIQAGAHGEFTLAFGREDHDEFLGGVSVKMPEGLLGSLVGIPLCGEAQANAGTCSAASELGTVEALTGPGANPFLVSGGHVYLTEGYGGSQFGLSIVVPAVAGPYTLGGVEGKGQPADSGTVVVRSQIFVDRHTAQLTVTSGQLPSMLDGIPLQLKAVNVRIDRPGFMFNPTSCEKKQLVGTLSSIEGMSASVSSSFQVTNCAALSFKPKLTAATKAKHSRKNGAQLQVNVTSSEGQADIAKVRVELPKKLPSRLSTLQQACTASQFDASPASCPAASIVGSATVSTPVLPVPLSGPAYFVSHGGAKFPELILVLQGYGVTVELNGETFISKAGITSSTFKTVPDVPFDSFKLTLPQGPHSALAGNGNLCNTTLSMPTTITGQNGAVLTQQIKVKVGGCTAARKKTKKAAKKGKVEGKGSRRHAPKRRQG